VRNLFASLILIGNLVAAAPSFAVDVNLHKHGADDIKGVCGEAGGSFSQGADSYGCGTDCHGKPGTTCTVFCKVDQNCVAQVLGGRRPRTVLDALKIPDRHAR
jgi:hypothetical protein